MSDEARVVTPHVNLARRGFRRDVESTGLVQIQNELMRGARTGARDRAGEPGDDGAVQVSAQDSLDLPMTADHLGEPCGIRESHEIHLMDSRLERRMVGQNDGGNVLRFRQTCFEPHEAILAQSASRLT